jgi:cytochrome c oxidase subunit 2
MPPPVRRTTTAILAATGALLALVLAAPAGANDGGLVPQNAGTPSAKGIEHDYVFIGGFTLFILILVEGLLILFVVRYRHRKRPRSVEGYQIHGSNRLELGWTVAPALILAAIAAFVLVTLGGINGPSQANAADQVNVTVIGHQFYWEFRYPNGAFSINTLYAPQGREVRETIVAPDVDVIHSWWVPPLGGKTDAIPGRINHNAFNAPKTGTYEARCAELCGIQHAEMLGSVVVQPQGTYRASTAKLLGQLRSASPQLGKQMFDGVCEKCHRISGPRFVGPTLGGNPILKDPKALADIVRHGRGQMPPVGAGWSDQQIKTLVAYTKKVAAGGGS